MDALTKKLLALTEQPYDSYNAILPEIKGLLADRATDFERVLAQELPLTTARRAYRTAIKAAMGEPDVSREWRPSENFRKR